jgi:hypothetical protein
MVIALGDARNWRNLDAVAAQFSYNKLPGAALLNAYTAALFVSCPLKVSCPLTWVPQM